MRHPWLALLLVTALPIAAAHADPAPGDTLLVDLPDLVVRGDEAAPIRLDRTHLDPPAIRRQDAASLADLGALLPSARVVVNSRGDAHVMVRGAPERICADLETWIAIGRTRIRLQSNGPSSRSRRPAPFAILRRWAPRRRRTAISPGMALLDRRLARRRV